MLPTRPLLVIALSIVVFELVILVFLALRSAGRRPGRAIEAAIVSFVIAEGPASVYVVRQLPRCKTSWLMLAAAAGAILVVSASAATLAFRCTRARSIEKPPSKWLLVARALAVLTLPGLGFYLWLAYINALDPSCYDPTTKYWGSVFD